MKIRKSASAAFTLIEMLVVVSILGILIGLILPAVQSARENSRRLKCVSNLRQLGIATHSHETAKGALPSALLPSGFVGSASFSVRGAPSIHAQLLPFLDQMSLYNSVNFASDLKFRDSDQAHALLFANMTLRSISLDIFLCPSDGRGVSHGNNYRGCTGSAVIWEASPLLTPFAGVFSGLRARTSRDVRDGLSHTISFSERLMGTGGDWGMSASRDVWRTGLTDSFMLKDDVTRICGYHATAIPDGYSGMGHLWSVAGYEDTLYNNAGPPNWNVMDCSTSYPRPRGSEAPLHGGAISARSNHPGGVCTLFMDGSVRFVKESISLPAWRAAATREGGESLSLGLE